MVKEARHGLHPRVIRLDAARADYRPILTGPPASVTMRSGLVTLNPGKSVGVHSTEDFEELIIVLEGQGEVRIARQDPLAIHASVAAYCPPGTEHDVVNTGNTPLQYVFVVAKAGQ
jgi:quercetin dioxygenase-like cupin family protein